MEKITENTVQRQVVTIDDSGHQQVNLVDVPRPVIPKGMQEALAAPFDVSCYEWNSFRDSTSLKAAWIIERLNQVFGVGRWTVKYELLKEDPDFNCVFAKGNLVFLDYDCVLPDIFVSDKKKDGKADQADIYKSVITKIISKGASYLGIGLDAYKGKITKEMLTGNKSGSGKGRVDKAELQAEVDHAKVNYAINAIKKATQADFYKIDKKYEEFISKIPEYKAARDARHKELYPPEAKEPAPVLSSSAPAAPAQETKPETKVNTDSAAFEILYIPAKKVTADQVKLLKEVPLATREEVAVQEVDKATSPEEMKEIQIKWNGLTKESEKYKSAFKSKLDLLLTNQLDDFNKQATYKVVLSDLADLAVQYPSLATHPDYKEFFEQIFEDNRKRIAEFTEKMNREAAEKKAKGEALVKAENALAECTSYDAVLKFEKEYESIITATLSLRKKVAEKKEVYKAITAGNAALNETKQVVAVSSGPPVWDEFDLEGDIPPF